MLSQVCSRIVACLVCWPVLVLVPARCLCSPCVFVNRLVFPFYSSLRSFCLSVCPTFSRLASSVQFSQPLNAQVNVKAEQVYTHGQNAPLSGLACTTSAVTLSFWLDSLYELYMITTGSSEDVHIGGDVMLCDLGSGHGPTRPSRATGSCKCIQSRPRYVP